MAKILGSNKIEKCKEWHQNYTLSDNLYKGIKMTLKEFKKDIIWFQCEETKLKESE